ncbi:MAG: riboflavin synthase [Myxococcota bacterium]
MFTGIVEHVGRVVGVEQRPDLLRLQIDLGPIAEGIRLGDSIAVLGCCLTVTRIEGALHTFEAIPETLSRTRLGRLAPGDPVNLERAMAAAARFDGHLVQGHVDGLGEVEQVVREGNEVLLHVRVLDPALAPGLVDKGSVAIDGVSLTVVRARGDRFHVALIPHTLDHTTLSGLRAGDAVHLEVDVFAKYLQQYLDRVLPGLIAAAVAARDGSGAT